MRIKFYFRDNIKVLKFRLSRFKRVLLGYIEKDGTPKKCPHCKSKELEVYETFRHDQGFIEEEWVRCKHCKQQVGVWAYGGWTE